MGAHLTFDVMQKKIYTFIAFALLFLIAELQGSPNVGMIVNILINQDLGQTWSSPVDDNIWLSYWSLFVKVKDSMPKGSLNLLLSHKSYYDDEGDKRLKSHDIKWYHIMNQMLVFGQSNESGNYNVSKAYDASKSYFLNLIDTKSEDSSKNELGKLRSMWDDKLAGWKHNKAVENDAVSSTKF